MEILQNFVAFSEYMNFYSFIEVLIKCLMIMPELLLGPQAKQSSRSKSLEDNRMGWVRGESRTPNNTVNAFQIQLPKVKRWRNSKTTFQFRHLLVFKQYNFEVFLAKIADL